MMRYWGHDNVPQSVLPPTLKPKGVNEVNFRLFLSIP